MGNRTPSSATALAGQQEKVLEKQNVESTPDGDRNVVMVVQRFLETLQRSVRTIRGYYPGHPTVGKLKENVIRAFQQVIPLKAPLQISVKPFAFFYNKELLLADDNRIHSIAFKMYQSGVRQLIFLDESAQEDLLKLVDILVNQFSGEEASDDFYVAYRKASLSKIKVYIVDFYGKNLSQSITFFENPAKNETVGSLQKAMQSKTAPKIPDDRILKELDIHRLGEAITILDRGDVIVDPGLLDKLCSENRDDIALAKQLLVYCFYQMKSQTDAGIFKIFSGIVTAVVRIAIDNHRYGLLASLFDGIHVLTQEQHNPKPESRVLTQILFKSLINRTFYNSVIEQAASLDFIVDNEACLNDIARILRFFADQNSKDILQRLLPFKQWLQSLEPLVLRIGQDHLSLIRDVLLASDSDVALDQIDLIAKIQSPQTSETLLQCVEHKSSQVKIRLISLLATHNNPKVLVMLLSQARSNRVDVRLHALKALANFKDQRITSWLCSQIERPQFQEKPEEERTAFYECLAQVAGVEALPLFQSIIKEQSKAFYRFLSGKQEDALAIIRILKFIEDPKTVVLLKGIVEKESDTSPLYVEAVKIMRLFQGKGIR